VRAQEKWRQKLKILTITELPDELIQSWLEHIKDFDIRFPGKCKISAVVSSPDKTLAELNEIIGKTK
jgi:hypothetical protein